MISTSIQDSQNAIELTLTNQDNQAEAAILEAARHNPRLFAPIYERYVTRIYRYCLRRVDDPHDAEDLTSLIFTRALSSLAQYRGGLVAAWLFRIAHNAVINHQKRPRRDVILDERAPAPTGEPLEALIRAEEEDTLTKLVATLPADQQDLLLLRIVGDLSAQEIGAMYGKRPGAIRVTLHRIFRHLYRLYQAGGADHAR